MTPIKTAALLVCAGLALSPTIARADNLVLDLKTGVITQIRNAGQTPVAVSSNFNPTATYPYATVRMARSANCRSTPFEARVDLNLAAPAVGGGPTPQVMKTVRLAVEYEGKPSGWTTHIGDDPANDGYGGGTSLLAGTAEVQIYDGENLAVYSTGIQSGVVDRIAFSELALTDGAIGFVISDQFLSFGQPYQAITTPNTKQLFAIPDKTGDRRIFAGFNRVIAGRADRTGCGVSKVIVTLEP